MLDKRLEGKGANDITLKFVREVATEEELRTAEVKKVLGIDTIQICDILCPLDGCEGKELLGWFIDTHEKLKLLTQHYEEGDKIRWEHSYDDIPGIAVYQEQEIVSRQLGERALQSIWREKIKSHLKEKEEYESYLKLKSKFEGDKTDEN